MTTTQQREEYERQSLGCTRAELNRSVIRWKQHESLDLLDAAASILSNGHEGRFDRERIDRILNQAKSLIFDAMESLENLNLNPKDNA